jgi:hypothetical protein
MSNDPSSGGDQPGWQGQQPYPGSYGQQPGDQPAYPAGSYPSPPQAGQQPGAYGQQGGYGQTQSWSQQQQGGQPPAGWQGGPAGAGPGGVAPGGTGRGDQARGTFSALFDFGFNSFATPVVIKILYVLGLVGIGLAYVGFVITAFAQSPGYGLLVLVLGALVALFYVIFFRVFLEFYYAVVRMSEDIREMRNRS